MRPVVRGDCPQDQAGQELRFAAYSHARRELIARLGEYCSYCEMHLDASLAVEHVKPKQPPGSDTVLDERALDWHNFLLACTNCNSVKGNQDLDLDTCLWPDRDNTFRALAYAEGGMVSSRSGSQQALADRLIALVGLDRMPDTAAASDRRWLNRREAWDMAIRAQGRLERSDSEDMRQQIVETAQANGFWSVWMTVFNSDADMLARLIATFPGTCSDCFDAGKDFSAVHRPGGLC